MPRTATPISTHLARAGHAVVTLQAGDVTAAERLAAAKALESAACQIRRALVKDPDAA